MALKLASGVVYVGLSAGALGLVGGPLRQALGAVWSPFAYAPDLEAPWLWIGFALAVCALVAGVVRRLADGRKAGMGRYVALVVAVAGAVTARRGLEPPPRMSIEDGLTHAIARAELAADAAFAKDKRYPATAEALAVELPGPVRTLGFWRRGARRLPTRIIVKPGALEPVLSAEGRSPGDVVVAIDDGGTRYWITAFTLLRGGRVGPLVDRAGRVVMATGLGGRPRSRLDPAFPDYPNKLGSQPR